MANKFNVDLKGRVIVLAQQVETSTTASVMTRLARVTGGNGADPNGMGSMVFCKFICNPARTGDNEVCMVDAHCTSGDIERLASDDEIRMAEKMGGGQ